MLKRLRQRFAQRLNFWFNPLRCPDCKLKCLSKPGLGRHLAAHKRKTAQQLLQLQPKEASNG